MHLSILDQSPIATGSDASTAFAQTTAVAKLADDLGYHRFWVSEHHDTPRLAGSSPEVLIAHLAANTKRIRVGSGGVMLPHYSAYKVAENFRVLEALYPQRIDLGLGRAPGGMPRARMALQEGRQPADYALQVADLTAYLTDTLPVDHRFSGLKATPVVQTAPPLWLLGSSDWSAHLAAVQGTAFMYAHFINSEGGVEAVRNYHDRFEPSTLRAQPQAGVAVFVICAETDHEADLIAKSLDLALVMLANGQVGAGTPTIEEALAYPYGRYELLLVHENRKRMVVGDATSVRQQLEALAAAYGVEEVMTVTSTARFEDRMHSHELVAKSFGLNQTPQTPNALQREQPVE